VTRRGFAAGMHRIRQDCAFGTNNQCSAVALAARIARLSRVIALIAAALGALFF
jgi:hypothetical protein